MKSKIPLLILLVSTIGYSEIHRFTRPPFEAWLKGGVASYDVTFQDASDNFRRTGLGISGGVSLNLISLASGFDEGSSDFPKRIQVFASLSFEKLPNTRLPSTLFRDTTDYGDYRFERDVDVDYHPLDIALSADSRFNVLPFLDLSAELGFSIINDIYKYSEVYDQYLIDIVDGSDITGGERLSLSRDSTERGIGLCIGYGGEVFLPFAPMVRLGFQMRHHLIPRPSFSYPVGINGKYEVESIHRATTEPSFYISYSFQRVNKTWIAERDAIRGFNKFLNRTRSVESMGSAQLHSEMMNLDKLYSTIKEPGDKMARRYSELKSILYKRWIGLQHTNTVEGKTALSHDELSQIRRSIDQVCCGGVSGSEQTTTVTKTFIDNELKRIENAEQEFQDSIDAMQQEENDKIAAEKITAVFDNARHVDKSGQLLFAYSEYERFLSLYSSSTQSIREFIDTSGISLLTRHLSMKIDRKFADESRFAVVSDGESSFRELRPNEWLFIRVEDESGAPVLVCLNRPYAYIANDPEDCFNKDKTVRFNLGNSTLFVSKEDVHKEIRTTDIVEWSEADGCESQVRIGNSMYSARLRIKLPISELDRATVQMYKALIGMAYAADGYVVNDRIPCKAFIVETIEKNILGEIRTTVKKIQAAKCITSNPVRFRCGE
jgi:hypothetical protein